MLATALAPVIGYDEAAKLAKEAFKSGRTIRELALERGMDPAELDRLLDPATHDRAGPRRRTRRRLTIPRAVTRCGPGRTSCDRSLDPQHDPDAVHAVPNTSQPADHGMSIATPPRPRAADRSLVPGQDAAASPTRIMPTIATVWAAARPGRVDPPAIPATQGDPPRAEPDDRDGVARPGRPARRASRRAKRAADDRDRQDRDRDRDRRGSISSGSPASRAGPAARARRRRRPSRDRHRWRRDGRHQRPGRRVEPGVERPASRSRRSRQRGGRALEERRHLLAVALAPRRAGTGEQDPHVHPFSTRGGMMPGSPSATGSGPSVMWVVSIVRTPSPSTSIA